MIVITPSAVVLKAQIAIFPSVLMSGVVKRSLEYHRKIMKLFVNFQSRGWRCGLQYDTIRKSVAEPVESAYLDATPSFCGYHLS